MTHPIPRPAALALAAALLAAPVACTGARAAPAPERDPAVPVRVAPIARGPVERPVRAAGVVAARDERDLSFKVGGVVARVAVREGDRVRRGQVLAALDATQVAAGARQAREALAKAERDLARARALRAAEVIPAAALEDAETGQRVARAAAEAAEFEVRTATLVAPDDGWVDRRLVEPGEIVAPGRPIVRVSGRSSGFVVRAGLADRDVLGLSAGDRAAVTLDARPGERIPGRVADVARSATRGTGTYEVEIRLDGARAAELLSGLTAKVEIARAVPAEAAVPIAALQGADGADGAVFVVEGDRARRVPVRIAFLQGDLAVLSLGPEGHDAVVTEGAARLSDGARVRRVP